MESQEITKVEQSGPIARNDETKELLSQDGLIGLVREILSDLDTVKKEALDAFYMFKDLLANEGEGSAATKEQMAAMLQVYLSSEDTKLKLLDIAIKSKRPVKGSSPGTNINIMSGLSRREMLEEIDQVMGTKRADIEVVDGETIIETGKSEPTTGES